MGARMRMSVLLRLSSSVAARAAALPSTDQSPKQHLQSAHFRAYVRQHPVKLLADFFRSRPALSSITNTFFPSSFSRTETA